MKGGNFENEIAKKLSLWLTKGKRDDLVCRTDSSGGRGTIRTKNKKESNKYLFGDLKHSDDEAKPLFDIWSIEAKTGYGIKKKDGMQRWDILDLLDSSQKETVLQKFWNQCVRDAELSKREPILIFRRNGRKPCIAFNRIYFLDLLRMMDEAFNFSELNIFCFSMLTIVNLDDFLSWADPKKINVKIS